MDIYEVDGDPRRIRHTWKGQTKRPEKFDDRRRVGIGTPSVEAREYVTVKADPVGTPNRRLLSGVVHV